MTGDPIPDEHYVARHLTKTRIENGLPAEHAFIPKEGEHEVSVNWLGSYDESTQEAQLDCVRGVLNRRRTVRPSCRLALLNVGAAKQAVRDALEDEALGVSGSTAAIDVVEDPITDAADPLRDDPSHAHIVLPELPADHENAAAALRSIVRLEDMRPARVRSPGRSGRERDGRIRA